MGKFNLEIVTHTQILESQNVSYAIPTHVVISVFNILFDDIKNIDIYLLL